MNRLISSLIAVFLVMLHISTAQAANITYEDVTEASWYAESVRYMSDRSLMNGVGGKRFDPDGLVTRGMFVTILYRLDGAPEVADPSPFEDVMKNSYYQTAVTWAANNGIVGGYSNKQFGPNDRITREQLATILYRYATKKGHDTVQKSTLEQYADAEQISAFAVDGMCWAHAAGIVNGVSNSTLGPQSNATRSQVATMIMRFDRLNSNVTRVVPGGNYYGDNSIPEKNAGSEQAEPATERVPEIKEPSYMDIGVSGSEAAKVYYTVVFKDYDGTVLGTENVADGGKAVPPGTPKRNGYLFNGWDGNFSTIHSDQVFTAQYYQETFSNQNQAASKDDLQSSAAKSAITQPTISVARVEVEAGTKNVIVPVEIKSNPGILGITLTIRYDDSVLTLISAENGAAVSDYLAITPPGKFESGCRFVWDGQDVSDKIAQDGVLLTLYFSVADGAAGVYPIDLTYAPGDIVDNYLSPVNLATNPGSISVILKS